LPSIKDDPAISASQNILYIFFGESGPNAPMNNNKHKITSRQTKKENSSGELESAPAI
jgi:hypothetical protein